MGLSLVSLEGSGDERQAEQECEGVSLECCLDAGEYDDAYDAPEEESWGLWGAVWESFGISPALAPGAVASHSVASHLRCLEEWLFVDFVLSPCCAVETGF